MLPCRPDPPGSVKDPMDHVRLIGRIPESPKSGALLSIVRRTSDAFRDADGHPARDATAH
jgi:hypothetical protein